MSSLDVFVNNINKISKKRKLLTYAEIADHLSITESTLKQWERRARAPTLKNIDSICNKLSIPTYIMLQRDADLDFDYDFSNNNSRENMIKNLEEIFFKKGRFSWESRAALFSGFVSVNMLKQYFKKKDYRTPPLNRLDEMAEALGIPVYKIIKENGLND